MLGFSRFECLGTLGLDPEIIKKEEEISVVILNLASNEIWTSKQNGDKGQKTEWTKCVAYGNIAKSIADKNFKAKDHLLCKGKIQTRKYLDKDNIERTEKQFVIEEYHKTNKN